MAQALWFSGPRQAELRDEEIAEPGPTDILVRGICALVSAGSELNLYRGEGNLPDLEMFPTARGHLPFPVKFGYQEIGEVEFAGAESGFSVGNRVLCFHPHQSRFTLDAALASRIPDDLAPERAAFGGLMGVGLNSVLSTPVLVGDCVAVSGLGVVGVAIAHFARLTASRLIVIDPIKDRQTRVGWIGADAFVTPDEAAAAIDDLTGGRGVDVFFEASGAPAALQTAIDLTGQEGTVSVASWYGSRPVPLRLSPEFHLRRLKFYSTGPMMPPHLAPRWDFGRSREVVWEHLRRLDVENSLISHRVPFSDAPRAYQMLDDPTVDTLAVLLQHEV